MHHFPSPPAAVHVTFSTPVLAVEHTSVTHRAVNTVRRNLIVNTFDKHPIYIDEIMMFDVFDFLRKHHDVFHL